jgi:hypothetical protein
MRARLLLLGAMVIGGAETALVACGGAGTAATSTTSGSGAGSTGSGGSRGEGGTSSASTAGSGGAATSSSTATSTTTTTATAGSGGGGESAGDAGPDGCNGGGDAGALCYANACPGPVHSLQENRDRLVADLAKRKCTDSCTLWAALNQGERYVFLMDTAYFGDPSSRLYPPGADVETALDHAVALYSINGPMAGQGVDGSGRGGNDYNRIYLGFDALGECVMRNFAIANPAHTPMWNQWVKSDDLAGPHAPFTQREMIYWYKAWYDLQSNGPQFHHWAKDADFSQSGIDVRLGVCGVMDRSLVESTVAFDFYHNSDPLGDYAGQGGYGWQIVGMYLTVDPDWSYMPTGCPTTPPVNMDPYGGGTFAGMGPSQVNGVCVPAPLGDAGCP